MPAKTEVIALLEAARLLRESIDDVLAARAADPIMDTQRLDKLQAVADRKGCGWNLEGGRPELRHKSQEPAWWSLREAIDAMEEPDARHD